MHNTRPYQGWQRNFIPKNFRGIDSEWLPLFRGRKCSFRGIPGFTEGLIPKLGTEENGMKKICFTKNPAPANRKDIMFSSETCFGSKFREFDQFFSTERNSKHFSPLRNGSERNFESFLFRGMVQNGIPRVCFFFVPWYRIPIIFLLCGTVRNGIPRVFCSAE
jgi:hypothetical protein